jgi:cephalosporin-C deacetylase-like acetyl esterase
VTFSGYDGQPVKARLRLPANTGAVCAVDTVRELESVDASRVAALGQSQGG